MAEVRQLQTRCEQLALPRVAVDYGQSSSLALATEPFPTPLELQALGPCEGRCGGGSRRMVPDGGAFPQVEGCRTVAELEQPVWRRRTLGSSLSRLLIGR